MQQENQKKTIRKGDLIIPIPGLNLASKLYLTESEPSASGFIFIRAAKQNGHPDQRHSNYAFSALASNFTVHTTSVELRRMSGHTQTERFDDIIYDKRENEFWTQVCAACNAKLKLHASDYSAHPDLICGVRGCENAATFYHDLDIATCDRCRKDYERRDLVTGDSTAGNATAAATEPPPPIFCGECRDDAAHGENL